MRLVDPTFSAAPAAFAPAPRLATLDGLRLGLLANGKTHGELLLDALAEQLFCGATVPESVLRLTKPHPSEPPTPEQLELLRSHSTAVLSAIGDCGSCSSCSIVDGIRLERAGIPSVVLVTEPFVSTARAIAAMNGAPDYRFAVVPHPVTSLSPARVRERAAAVAADVAAILLGSPSPAAPKAPSYGGAVADRLADLTVALAADGVTLTVDHADDALVRLRLSVAAGACDTCVLPAATIRDLAAVELGPDAPPVDLIDTRTT